MLSVSTLTQFELYAERCTGSSTTYAKLRGSTFPLNHMLGDAGANWSPDEQSWIFFDEHAYKTFITSLNRLHRNDDHVLEEEAIEFVVDPDVRTALRRFIDFGANALGNRELLELLLSYDTHVTDPIEVSGKLMDEFGSLGAILALDSAHLARFHQLAPRTCALLRAIQLTIERVMHEPIEKNPIIGSWDALLAYLRARLQHKKTEELLVIYLDRRNQLIKTESAQGTVDHVPLYPREVAARALQLYASAVIIAHNHPAGDLNASKADILTTKNVHAALKALDIKLYDHVIVSNKAHYSFAAECLI